MNELINILWYAGINKFLYSSQNIIKTIKKWNDYFAIQIELNIKQLSFIETNTKDFWELLNIVLSTFNKTFWYNFKTITFNNVMIWEEVFKNCIFFYNSKKHEWFIKTCETIKIRWEPKTNENTLLDKIISLISKKDVSVRNLIKLWMPQARSRELFNFLKEKEVFKIEENNKNIKTYNFEKLKNISKNDIEKFLSV